MPPLAPDAPPATSSPTVREGVGSQTTSSPTVREGFTPTVHRSSSEASTFNAYLARAKTKAIECLLNICENADHSATPADIRRAATAILRCAPLHDDDDQLHSHRPRPRHHIPGKPPIIQPTPARSPASSAPVHTPTTPAPASPSPQVPDAEQRASSSPPEADCRVPLAPVAQSAAPSPPPPAPTIARLLGEPSPQSLTPSIDEIFRALAALEALRRSDPERHQSLDPGNTLQPLIDFIRSIYPVDGLPPDHPLSITIRDIESAHRAAERQSAALNNALADLHAAAPSSAAYHHLTETSHTQSSPALAPTLNEFDLANNIRALATISDPRGPPH